jgi:TM2 domain-containing membrane protein YozV
VSDVTQAGGRDGLRVGTRERAEAGSVLGEHLNAGRLGHEEYEQRVAIAAEAVTYGDIRALFTDLPPPHPPYLAEPAPPAASPYPAPFPVGAPHHPVVMADQSDKSRIVAGVLQILLPFGIGRFYTGQVGMGMAQLLLAFVIIGVIWSFIDGVILLVAGGTDRQGRPLHT